MLIGLRHLIHEPIAAGLGITAQQLAGLRAGNHAPLPAGEALVADAAAETMDHGDLSASTYERVRDLVGEAQLVELTTVVGYYRLRAMQMTVLRVSPPVSGYQRSTAPSQDAEA